MRVNIHPEPIGDFDINLPYISAVYLQNYTEKFEKLKKLGKSDITLINNGEPPLRLYAAQTYLAQQGIETKIQLVPDRYSGPDRIFNGKPYATIPGAIPGCQELVEHYLAVYKQLDVNVNQVVSTDIVNKLGDIFYGYKYNNHLKWYHYGLAMPDTNCPVHLRIREMYDSVFWSYVQSLSDFLGYTKKDVADRLIMRIGHTTPGQYRDPVNKTYLTRHWDTSMMTGSLYSTHPGNCIEVDGKMTPVEDFFDQTQETFIIPGIDYCDEFETQTAPTWHEVVENSDKQERASLVAFLKRRRFRE
jgi:hypothetical protein